MSPQEQKYYNETILPRLQQLKLSPNSSYGLQVSDMMLARYRQSQKNQQRVQQNGTNLKPQMLDEVTVTAPKLTAKTTDNSDTTPLTKGTSWTSELDNETKTALGNGINYDASKARSGEREAQAAANKVGLGLGAIGLSVAAAPVVGTLIGDGIATASSAWATWAAAHPMEAAAIKAMKTGIDIGLTAEGGLNAVSKNGVQKTYRLAKEGNTRGAIKSGIGDAFNILGVVGLAGDVNRTIKGINNFKNTGKVNPLIANFAVDLANRAISHPKLVENIARLTHKVVPVETNAFGNLIKDLQFYGRNNSSAIKEFITDGRYTPWMSRNALREYKNAAESEIEAARLNLRRVNDRSISMSAQRQIENAKQSDPLGYQYYQMLKQIKSDGIDISKMKVNEVEQRYPGFARLYTAKGNKSMEYYDKQFNPDAVYDSQLLSKFSPSIDNGQASFTFHRNPYESGHYSPNTNELVIRGRSYNYPHFLLPIKYNGKGNYHTNIAQTAGHEYQHYAQTWLPRWKNQVEWDNSIEGRGYFRVSYGSDLDTQIPQWSKIDDIYWEGNPQELDSELKGFMHERGLSSDMSEWDDKDRQLFNDFINSRFINANQRLRIDNNTTIDQIAQEMNRLGYKSGGQLKLIKKYRNNL